MVLILCGLGVPFPEEATFLAAGFACRKLGADASVELLCVIGVLGIMGGDSIPYWVGRKYGLSLLSHRRLAKLMPPHRIEQVRKFFASHGSKSVFVARFVAGLRMPTFFMAGSMHIKYRTFFLFDLAGALISCPISIYAAWRWGTDAVHWIHKSKVAVFIVIGLIVAYMIYHIISHREKPPVTDASTPTAPAIPTAPQTSLPLPVKTPEVQS